MVIVAAKISIISLSAKSGALRVSPGLPAMYWETENPSRKICFPARICHKSKPHFTQVQVAKLKMQAAFFLLCPPQLFFLGFILFMGHVPVKFALIKHFLQRPHTLSLFYYFCKMMINWQIYG